MTEIEQKALALLNEVQIEMHRNPGWYEGCNRTNSTPVEALCRAIEQHEAFKQEVSDAVESAIAYAASYYAAASDLRNRLARFILPKPVDPLVEAVRVAGEKLGTAEWADFAAATRAEIEKRGGKIVWGEKQ